MWLLLALTATAAEPDLTGRYTLSETADALASAHASAVERAVEQLNWAFRPFARPRLEKSVSNCAVLELSFGTDAFQSTCDDRPRFTHDRDNGEHVFTGDNGKPFEVSFSVAATSVTLQFSGEEGGQRIVYAPAADGSLVLTKEIFSPYLSTPVAWTVRYARER